MNKEILIIALILALIYLYYQNRKLAQLPTNSGNSTSPIFELDEDKEDLIAEKDVAIRSKNEAEQEVLSLSNQLRNKQQEVSRKETEIERLKSEKSKVEISLNKKLSEKNGLITTQQKELNSLKEKYSKQGKQLDEEQLECKKLEEKVEELETKIKELTKSMPELKEKVKEGVKPSDLKKLKRSKSADDIKEETKYPYTTLISQQEELAKLKKETTAKSDTIKLLRQKIEDLEKTNPPSQLLTDQLKEKQTQIENLRKHLETTNQELTTLKKNHSTLLDTNLELKHQGLKD
nr:2841_t:CDS:2 [Entrophospora candida]